jgi:uncharacterized membrane protein
LKKNNKDNKKIKINDYNILYINLQLISTLASVILLVVSIFKKVVFPYFFLSIGITLLSIGLSNKYVYMKEDMVKNNFISGILIIIFSLLKIFGVI